MILRTPKRPNMAHSGLPFSLKVKTDFITQSTQPTQMAQKHEIQTRNTRSHYTAYHEGALEEAERH